MQTKLKLTLKTTAQKGRTHAPMLPEDLDEVERVETQQQHQLVLALPVVAGGLRGGAHTEQHRTTEVSQGENTDTQEPGKN